MSLTSSHASLPGFSVHVDHLTYFPSEWATQPKFRVATASFHLQPPTMPPIRKVSAEKDGNKEGRILLAIQAIQKQQIASIREAARQFDIPRTTLQRRLTGDIYRSETRANSHKLTKNEEDSLIQWIISMDIRGAAPRPASVQEMANILLLARGQTPSQTVGKNWVTNFVKRHSELATRFSRRYNYERAKIEDPKII